MQFLWKFLSEFSRPSLLSLYHCMNLEEKVASYVWGLTFSLPILRQVLMLCAASSAALFRLCFLFSSALGVLATNTTFLSSSSKDLQAYLVVSSGNLLVLFWGFDILQKGLVAILTVHLSYSLPFPVVCMNVIILSIFGIFPFICYVQMNLTS